jgi:hypothetical protein
LAAFASLRTESDLGCAKVDTLRALLYGLIHEELARVARDHTNPVAVTATEDEDASTTASPSPPLA